MGWRWVASREREPEDKGTLILACAVFTTGELSKFRAVSSGMERGL